MKCNKHPKYKAIRKPTANCSKCYAMFAETLRQKEVEAARPTMEQEVEIKKIAAQQKQKWEEIEKALDFYRLSCKLNNMNSSWRGIKITKERFSDGKWSIESSVWVDNGYGGNLHTTSATGETFHETLKDFIERVKEKDNTCSPAYM